MLNMVYCPFCDGQGVIYKAKIKNIDLVIYICDECDTVWKNTAIDEDSSFRFKDVMNDLGLQPLWSELEETEKI